MPAITVDDVTVLPRVGAANAARGAKCRVEARCGVPDRRGTVISRLRMRST